jgi:uncharacterized membrane protein YsdA (DUF1294 family)
MTGIIIGALLVLNLFSFILMGIDKGKAKRDAWRIPERTLLLACVPFSALGGLIGMHVFHHKTRKPKFFICVPAMLIVQAAAAYWPLTLIL